MENGASLEGEPGVTGRHLAAVALALTCSLVCGAALAAEGELPTGTIEVEVVYKDTG